MNESKTMTVNQWWDTYTPTENKGGSHFWETFGDEFKVVRQAEPDKVWTRIEADGQEYIINGLHYVNRVGYYITENGWWGDGDIVVELSKENQ